LVAAFVLSACNEKTSPKTEEPSATAAAKEGELCEEHGVLEAVCTKCNPKLIAV
jgi:cobalt-zinc-cadmium efflux system membrane fusion protein